MTVRQTLKDSTYVAVGIAVLGAQRIQDRSRKLTGHLKAMGDDAKLRIEPVITRVTEPVQAAVEPAKAMIHQVPATAVELGSQVAEIPNKMTSASDRLGETSTHVRAFVARAMAEGKSRLGGAVDTAKQAVPYTATSNATSSSSGSSSTSGSMNGTSGTNRASTNN